MLKKKKFEIKKKPVPVVEEAKPITTFITTDAKLVEKLQERFTIKNISLDRNTDIRTFEFDASKDEVEKFLGEGK